VFEEQLGGKPAHPAKKLRDPSAPDELAVILDQQLSHHVRVAGAGGVLDRVLDEPFSAAPGRRAAAGSRASSCPSSSSSSSSRSSPNRRW
jgi:hypothetical protein